LPIADSFFYPLVQDFHAKSFPPDTGMFSYSVSTGTGGKDSTLCSTLSIPETKHLTQSLSIYPNPTSGLVTIRSSELITRIEITSISGALIYNSSSQATTITIDLSTQASGIYFYTIASKDGRLERGKLILR
jgi:hypothetical protein